MRLDIIGGAEKTLLGDKQEIAAAFSNYNPFLHLLFEKKGLFVSFCSISNYFFVMDEKAFCLFGE